MPFELGRKDSFDFTHVATILVYSRSNVIQKLVTRLATILVLLVIKDIVYTCTIKGYPPLNHPAFNFSNIKKNRDLFSILYSLKNMQS